MMSSPSITTKGSSPTRSFAHSTAWPRPSGCCWRTTTTLAISAMSRICCRSSTFPVRSRCASSSGAMSKWSTIESLPRAQTRITSRTPALTASATMCWIVGTSTIGSSSFGTALVAGRKRVPSPAAGMTALRILDMAGNLARPTGLRKENGASRPPGSVRGFPHGLSAALFLLRLDLAVDAERGHGARLEPRRRDRLPAALARPEGPLLQPVQRRLDLRRAPPVAIAQPQRPVLLGLERAAVVGVGDLLGLARDHLAHDRLALTDQLAQLVLQQRTILNELALAHGPPPAASTAAVDDSAIPRGGQAPPGRDAGRFLAAQEASDILAPCARKPSSFSRSPSSRSRRPVSRSHRLASPISPVRAPSGSAPRSG